MSKEKQNKKQFLYTTCSKLVFWGDSMNNLSSYCGLTDSKMRASDTDLPVVVVDTFSSKEQYGSI